MIFVSLTRLRIRSVRFVPFFLVHAFRSVRQASKAPGFIGGAVLNDRDRAFWTMTAWDSQSSMRRFMRTGAHKTAMPHLLNWCDEASVAHWEQEDSTLPGWADAARRMRELGRASKVLSPSPRHAGLAFPDPKASAGSMIRRAS